jgi:hypothetical protein
MIRSFIFSGQGELKYSPCHWSHSNCRAPAFVSRDELTEITLFLHSFRRVGAGSIRGSTHGYRGVIYLCSKNLDVLVALIVVHGKAVPVHFEDGITTYPNYVPYTSTAGHLPLSMKFSFFILILVVQCNY